MTSELSVKRLQIYLSPDETAGEPMGSQSAPPGAGWEEIFQHRGTKKPCEPIFSLSGWGHMAFVSNHLGKPLERDPEANIEQLVTLAYVANLVNKCPN